LYLNYSELRLQILTTY